MCKVGIYLVCNYPSREKFLEAVRLCEKYDIDFIEIGIPFSDPTADGDFLEKAALSVIENGDPKEIFLSINEARGIFSRKIYIMTYANIVYSKGIEAFADRYSFVDGIILADVPFRESKRFKSVFSKKNVGYVHFVTPETDYKTIDMIKNTANDFIYFVSVRGTTGSRFKLDKDAKERLEYLKDAKQDVIVGFGIRTRDDIKEACKYADGAVIGTQAVKALNEDRFEEFLKEVKDA